MKTAFKNYEDRRNTESIKAVERAAVLQIEIKFEKIIKNYNRTCELRMIGTLLKSFRFGYVASCYYD